MGLTGINIYREQEKQRWWWGWEWEWGWGWWWGCWWWCWCCWWRWWWSASPIIIVRRPGGWPWNWTRPRAYAWPVGLIFFWMNVGKCFNISEFCMKIQEHVNFSVPLFNFRCHCIFFRCHFLLFGAIVFFLVPLSTFGATVYHRFHCLISCHCLPSLPLSTFGCVYGVQVPSTWGRSNNSDRYSVKIDLRTSTVSKMTSKKLETLIFEGKWAD